LRGACSYALRNAVEATPRGGIVRVRADHIKLEGASAVHLRVSDGGAGIDPSLDFNSIMEAVCHGQNGPCRLGLAYIACGARSDRHGDRDSQG